MLHGWYLSPLGTVKLGGDGGALKELRFVDGVEAAETQAESSVLAAACRWLDSYFEGKETAFEGVLVPEGTEFQQHVWAAVQSLPWGRTATYKEIAERMGLPASYARAVGTAVSRNPLWLIIPCHRVIPVRGGLGNYAGGAWRKAALLDLERKAL